MKKRIAIITALLSLMSMGKTVLIGTGAVISSAGFMLAASEKAYAENAEFYYKRGINKAEEGDFYGAIADYSKAIEINPRYSKAYNNRGNAKRALKDNDGAIADYSKAIEINSNSELAYFNRGNTKGSLKDYDGAIADYSKTIEINPNNGSAYKNRGIAKELIGDLKGACADWRRASAMGLKKTDLWILTQCY